MRVRWCRSIVIATTLLALAMAVGCDVKLPGERDFEVHLVGNYWLFRANATDIGIAEYRSVKVPGTVRKLVIDRPSGLIAGHCELESQAIEYFAIDSNSREILRSSDRSTIETFCAERGAHDLLTRAVSLEDWLVANATRESATRRP